MTFPEPIVWLIDAENVRRGAPGRHDFLKMRHLVAEQIGDPEAVHYFTSPGEATPEHERFLDWLKIAPPNGPGFRLHRHRRKTGSSDCPGCGRNNEFELQRGVDVAISVLAMQLAYEGAAGTIILSAGDSDFGPMVENLRERAKVPVVIANWSSTIAADLQPYASRILDFSAHYESRLMRTNGNGNTNGHGGK